MSCLGRSARLEQFVELRRAAPLGPAAQEAKTGRRDLEVLLQRLGKRPGFVEHGDLGIGRNAERIEELSDELRGIVGVHGQRIAGLEPAEPAWGRYRLAPRLGSLRDVEAYAPTPAGELRVHWTCVGGAGGRGGGTLRGDISAPPTLAGELLVYARTGARGAPRVRVDGRRARAKRDGEGYRYRLPPGTREVLIR